MPGMSCSKHVAGVPGCEGCRAVWTRYNRRRKDAVAAGTWLPKVPAAEVQQHLDMLKAAGMSLRKIAAAARVSAPTVHNVKDRSYLQGATAAAILAVVPTAPARRIDRVPIGPSSRRVRSLLALGWTLAEQGRCINACPRVMQEIVWQKKPHVTPATEARVFGLFEQLSATPGDSVRARQAARKHGWLPPLDLDESLEYPAEPAEPDDEPDEIAVERALAGELLALSDSDLIAAVQTGVNERGLALSVVSTTLHINHDGAKKLLAGQLPPRRAKRAARQAVAA